MTKEKRAEGSQESAARGAQAAGGGAGAALAAPFARKRVRRALLAFLLGLAAVLLFWPATGNEFVWDDPIVFERQLPYFDSFENVFFPPPGIPQFAQRYYRPLIVVTYQIDEAIASRFWPEEEREGARRFVYHLTPVLLHGAVTALVFLLGVALAPRRLALPGGTELPAALAALLFAVHPIHVESVAWMAGRSDVVAALFFVASLLAMIRARRARSWPWAIGAGVLALAAMLSKEAGVGLLLLAPFVALLGPRGEERADVPEPSRRAERRRQERSGRRGRSASPRRGGVGITLLVVAPVLAATFVYFLLRGAALDNMRAPGQAEMPLVGADFDALDALARVLAATGWYALKSLWPPPQSAFLGGMPEGILWPLLGTLVLFGLLVWTWLAIVRERAAGARPELLSAILFVTALAPSLAIALFRISESPLAERYLYLPSAGVCLIAGFLLARFAAALPAARSVRVAVAASLCLVIALPGAWQVRERNEVWASDLAFWLDAVAKEPEEGIPHLHLGIRLAIMGRDEEALASYRRAYEVYDDAEGRSKALNNACSVQLRMKRFEEAIDTCRAALREVERYPTPHYNIAIASWQLSQESEMQEDERVALLNEAARSFQRAIALNPRYVKALYQYGRLLATYGRVEEARRQLGEAARLAPASTEGRAARALLARLEALEEAGPR